MNYWKKKFIEVSEEILKFITHSGITIETLIGIATAIVGGVIREYAWRVSEEIAIRINMGLEILKIITERIEISKQNAAAVLIVIIKELPEKFRLK